ncbi:HD-GYP domain-containing protein [Anaerovorax odorimutans]|uniref:HD-GYP domain-containing protein n=1 Tax=Anaerovorax odorimutans TaxID=109327 RepID=UPI00040F3E6E|nr:HD domain-containing phosphohydrolase [Anaerovorax odorimutans]
MDKKNHFVYKNIRDIKTGDIILHPIYRRDGLLLINRYKTLSMDLILKIKQHISTDFFLLTVDSKEELDCFVNKKQFANIDYLKLLLKVVAQYKDVSTVPITIESFIEQGIDIEVKDGEIIIKDSDNDKFNYFEKLIQQVPLFNSFEKKLESENSRKRAVNIRKQLIEIICENKELYTLFIKMKLYKDIFFIHSINSTSMALMIGLCLELSDDELIDLAIATLFADVGFINIPKEQFNKYLVDKKINNNILLEHIEHYMKIARDIPILRKENIINAILDRHENYDGTGFPKGKKGNDINLAGRIIYICQSYDEYVGGYGKNALIPSEAINKLWNNKESEYDPDILKLFIYRTTFYKIGESIITKWGLKGKIIAFEDFINKPNKPSIVLEKK